MNLTKIDTRAMVENILDSRKYRDSGLNPNTIEDLIQLEAQKFTSQKKLLKSVRRKLHNIVAPYLGEPDYQELSGRLFQLGDKSLDATEMRDFCLDVLSEHASTAERIPYLREFYERIFHITGKPASILDLACGLHPLSFPWMDLPLTTQYHAYDIIQPRIDFINHFFLTMGLSPLAENRDILINPPQIHANLGLFLKEAHRFEKREPDCNRDFWASLDVDTLAVSLPAQNLSGTHSLLDQHRSLVYDNLPPEHPVKEILFEDEIVFLIEKPGRING